MTIVTMQSVGVTGALDTHADAHVAVAVCSTSHRLLRVAEFEATLAGYVAVYDWMAGFGRIAWGRDRRHGLPYGTGLARRLTAHGFELVEATRTRPDRQARCEHGKSDPVDAGAVSGAVLSGRATRRSETRDGLSEASGSASGLRRNGS